MPLAELLNNIWTMVRVFLPELNAVPSSFGRPNSSNVILKTELVV